MLSAIGNSKERNHLINQRRKIENERNGYLEKTRETRTIGLKARWEESSSKTLMKNRIKEKLDMLRIQKRQELEQRRDQLAQKLRMEQHRLEQELTTLQETPEQRRARMEQRARDLKAQRLQRDEEFNREMIQKKFRNECDMLREAQSRNLTLKVAATRSAQMQEKEELQQLKREQDEYFEQLWEQSRLKAEQRAENEEKARERAKVEQREVLQLQMQQLEQRKRDIEALNAHEEQLLHEKWALEQEEEARKVAQRKVAALRIRKETDIFNTRKREEEARKMREEKELDLRLLNAVLDKERMADDAENDKKKRVREEAKQYQKWLLQQMERDQEDESTLDRLRQQQGEEQWQKRLDVWERERRAREKLMQEVVEQRKQQLQSKMDELLRRKDEAIADKDRLQRELVASIQQQQEEIESRFRNEKKQQNYILAQIREKKERDYQEHKDLQAEYRAQLYAEEQYAQMLHKELERLTHERPSQFQHIPLVKKSNSQSFSK